MTRNSTSSSRPIDWRFVLPRASGERFEHLVLLGGSPSLAHTIIALGVAQRVSTHLTPGGPVDAVVGLAGHAASLEEATRDLKDDGVLYWEVDRRDAAAVATSPRWTVSNLKRLGLEAAGAYWVKPGFPRRQMYLPLDCGGAMHWYLESLFRTPTRLRRLARSALIAAADRVGLSAIAPCYAITAVRGERRFPAVIERAVAEGLTITGETQAVFLADGSTEWNRIAVLLFERGGRTPIAAIKLPRMPKFNQEIEWEHDILRRLSLQLPADFANSIPTSNVFRWHDLSVSVETCVRGSSLSSRARPATEGAIDDLRRVIDWLATFHCHTSAERVPGRKWVQQIVDGPFREYAGKFGLTPSEDRLFGALAASAASLTTETLPIVWQHADFGPPNVYLDGERVGVIDWETARRGPALQDLLYLVADWTAAVNGCTRDSLSPANFAKLFCATVVPGTFEHAVHEHIAEYMRRVGVPRSLFPFVLLSTFVGKALERTRRLHRIGSPAPDSRDGNRFVTYVGVLAEHTNAIVGHPASDAVRIVPHDVTVAIATMNRPAALARCVDSILSAQVRPADIVIVDQSSNADTHELVTARNWNDVVPVRYVRQPAYGLAASRNAAAHHTSRRIIAFTDDDCVPDEGWLAALVEGFNSPECPDAVTGRVLPLGPERPGYYAVSIRASEVPAVYRGSTMPWWVGTGGNAAFKRDWIQRIGGFDERLGAGSPGMSAEDMDIFYRLLIGGAAIKYHPKAVVHHERQNLQRRLASRPAYGFGMGAFCAMAAQHDAYAMCILARWCYDRMRALVGSCARWRWQRVREEALMLGGAARGIAYGVGRGVPLS